MTRTKLGWALILSVVAWGLAPCAFARHSSNGGSGKTGDGTTPVNVDLRDAAADGVTSDLVGVPYQDGVDGVSATIGKNYGVFKMDSSGGPRTVDLNFTGCGSFDLAEISSDHCQSDVLFVTGDGVDDTGVGLVSTGLLLNLQQMPVNGTALAEFSINYPSSFSKSTPNKISFYDLDGCGAPVLVTRTSSDTWTIEAQGSADGNACLYATTQKHGKRNFIGSVNLPFKMTITLQ